MTLRVGVVVATEFNGGGEHYLLRLYGGLAETGTAEGFLLGRLAGWGDLALGATDIGLGPKWSFTRVARSIISAPIEYRRALAAIRRAHAELPFAVFHLQYKREQLLFTRALAQMAPVVWTEHGVLAGGIRGRLLRPAYRWAARSVAHVVAVSAVVEDSVREVGVKGQVSTIPTAVDERRFHPPTGDANRAAACRSLGINPEKTLVGVVSRLHPHKRIERAIDAVDASEQFCVVIAGTGPASEELEARAAGKSVRFLGWVEEPATVHMASDVALLPFSPTEGINTALVEAAASGCALVGFDGDLMNDEVRDAGGVILEEGQTLDDLDWSQLPTMQQTALEWSAAYRLGPWLDAHAEVLRTAATTRS